MQKHTTVGCRLKHAKRLLQEIAQGNPSKDAIDLRVSVHKINLVVFATGFFVLVQ